MRRATWVCGEQRVLVEEVVDTIRGLLKPGDLDYVCLSCRDTTPRDVWAAADQYPLDPGAHRLVVVRDAEALTHWEPLAAWLDNSRQLPGVHLLFVSGETELPRETGSTRRGEPKQHIEVLQGKRAGQIVRCATPNETDAIAWVRRRSRLDVEMASYLLQRAGGDLAVVAAVCAKANLFDGTPTASVIDHLCTCAPPESFVEALLFQNKREALAALQRMDDHERGHAISLLVSRLDMLATLWRATRIEQSGRAGQGIPVFLAKRFAPVVKHYDPQRTAYRRQVLAVVDNAQRSGARTGVMEALVALW